MVRVITGRGPPPSRGQARLPSLYRVVIFACGGETGQWGVWSDPQAIHAPIPIIGLEIPRGEWPLERSEDGQRGGAPAQAESRR